MSEDTTTDKNLKVIYSPLGEKFEVSPANHIDLTRHAGWTDHKPHPDAVREHCEKNGLPVPTETETPAEAPAAPVQTSTPVETPAAPVETPAAVEPPAAPTETAPAETPAAPVETPAAAETSPEAPEQVVETEEGVSLKTAASDFDGLDRDAVKTYITDTFAGVEIDGRKGRDALVAQALELAAARAV